MNNAIPADDSNKDIEILQSLRSEYSKLLAEVQELEKVYYLLKLEISSLKCEKDFLLVSLDEIDLLIIEKEEASESKTTHDVSILSNTKKEQTPSARISIKRDIQESEYPSAPLPKSKSPSTENYMTYSKPITTPNAISKPEQIPVYAYQQSYPDMKQYSAYPYASNLYRQNQQGSGSTNVRYSFVPHMQPSVELPTVSSFSQAPSQQYMSMMQMPASQTYGDAAGSRYPMLSSSVNTMPSYPILSPQSPFYFNSPRQISSVAVDRQREMVDPYHAIPLPLTNTAQSIPYVATHVSPNNQQ